MVQNLFLNRWEQIKRQRESCKGDSRERGARPGGEARAEARPMDLETLKAGATEEDEALNQMRADYREKLRTQHEEKKLLLKLKVR